MNVNDEDHSEDVYDDEESGFQELIEMLCKNRNEFQVLFDDPTKMVQFIVENRKVGSLLRNPEVLEIISEFFSSMNKREDVDDDDDDYDDYDDYDNDENNNDENDDTEIASTDLRINIAEGPDVPDILVSAYSIGTKVTLDVGRKNNPVAKIISFNAGAGIFSNPE